MVDEIDDETNDDQSMAHAKPLFTVSEQIAQLKAKGMAFDLCSGGRLPHI